MRPILNQVHILALHWIVQTVWIQRPWIWPSITVQHHHRQQQHVLVIPGHAITQPILNQVHILALHWIVQTVWIQRPWIWPSIAVQLHHRQQRLVIVILGIVIMQLILNRVHILARHWLVQDVWIRRLWIWLSIAVQLHHRQQQHVLVIPGHAIMQAILNQVHILALHWMVMVV